MTKKFAIKNQYNNEITAVALIFSKYENNRLAIDLIEEETKCPYARGTINIPEIAVLLDNQIIIKNYSENEGMVDFFIDNELIKKDYSNFYVGHGGECCIVTMTDNLQALAAVG